MAIKQPLWQVPFVDLSAQYASLETPLVEAIVKVQRDADYVLGKEVGLFEQEFAAFCGAKYAIGVDSGTSALELALRAYGIGPGDEVITVANTFIATAFAISYTGATPVLVDVDPWTYTMDAACLERAITDRTRAVIPVHLYGHPADMDPILAVAKQHNLIVIEDACQAHGARYKGKPVGSMGHAAAFSFYPAKNLGAAGDGGAVVTSDERVAAALKLLRNYGQREKYHHLEQGYNRRLDTLQATILRIKLRHLDGWNAARCQHAALYNRLLVGTEVVTPRVAEYAEPVWHLYVIRIQDRDLLQAHLAEYGMATGIHYPIPVHLQPAYRGLGYRRGDFPVTESLAEEILSLPMYAELPAKALGSIAEAVREFDAEHAVEPLVAQVGR